MFIQSINPHSLNPSQKNFQTSRILLSFEQNSDLFSEIRYNRRKVSKNLYKYYLQEQGKNVITDVVLVKQKLNKFSDFFSTLISI